MDINPQKIKYKVKLSNNGKNLATVALDFGTVVIKGFRIRESEFKKHNENLWITPPVFKNGSVFVPIVIFQKEIWEEIEKEIIINYKKVEKESKKENTKSDKIVSEEELLNIF